MKTRNKYFYDHCTNIFRTNNIKTLPQVSCERSRHPRHSNTPGRQLRIAVTNVSRDLAASMETMVIDQVGIITYYLLFTIYYCA